MKINTCSSSSSRPWFKQRGDAACVCLGVKKKIKQEHYNKNCSTGRESKKEARTNDSSALPSPIWPLAVKPSLGYPTVTLLFKGPTRSE